jgi:uncharacterized protein
MNMQSDHQPFLIFILVLMAGCSASQKPLNIGSTATKDNQVQEKISATQELVEQGRNYLNGINGYRKDEMKAFTLLNQAANAGDAEGQYWLGWQYLKGLGVQPNKAKAFELFLLSANKGNDIDSQWILGQMYHYGDGITKDKGQAINWLQKAAEQNHVEAQIMLAKVYHDEDKNYPLALKWISKAAYQNNAEAQYDLGLMYALGQGVPQSYGNAFDWYQKAAAQGNKEAQTNLAHMYLEGIFVEKNLDKGAELLFAAAKQGQVNAQNRLAIVYLEGSFLPKDLNKALYWAKQVKEQDGNHYALDRVNEELKKTMKGDSALTKTAKTSHENRRRKLVSRQLPNSVTTAFTITKSRPLLVGADRFAQKRNSSLEKLPNTGLDE